MSTHRYLDRVCIVVIIAAMVLTVLFMNGERLGLTLVVDADSEIHSDSVYFTDNDIDASRAYGDATEIELAGEKAVIRGTGAYALDGGAVITTSGCYRVSGTLTDGMITVDAYASSKIWILLDGADISCSDGPAILVKQADKVFLTLADGSENTLRGGETLSDEAMSDGQYGVIFSHDDLTINGSGSLTIGSGYRHGIKANDDLVITGGRIDIEAAADGIHANESVRIRDAEITISCGDDGIVSEKEASWFYMESGTLSIDAEGDGIHAAASLTVEGGDISIERCYEGLEAPHITVTGGKILIRPEDDGFNANGGSTSFGMMFGPGMRSGARAAGQEESGAYASSAEEEESWIRIEGGEITIINSTGRDSDGLDSNGSIRISGGDIRISLPDSGSNCAIDFGSENGGVCEISGGTVIACGSSSMAESFYSTSAQCSILYGLSEGTGDGTLLELLDEGGNTLLSWEVPAGFSSANISCPQMEIGKSYTLVLGEDEESITITEVSASYGDAQSTMFGGNMNWGGMRRRNRPEGVSGNSVSGNSAGPGAGRTEMPAGMQWQEGFPGGGMPPEMPSGTQSAGEAPDGGRGMMRREGPDSLPAEESAEEGTVPQAKSLGDYSMETYRQLALCALVLSAGLAAAILYRRRR